MNFAKIQRLPQLLFAEIFSVVLLAGLIVFIFKPKLTESFYENRTLADMPKTSADAIWNGDYFADWDDYISDHAVGRETLLKLQTFISLYVLDRPTVNNSIYAEDADTLLPYYPETELTEEELETQAAAMGEQCGLLNELVQSYGGTFLYVAVPGQGSYYYEDYPWYLEEQPERFEKIRTAFAKEMWKNDVPYLDAGNVYNAHGHPDGYYFETDHHYNYNAALVTYQSILTQLNTLTDDNLKVYTTDELNFETLPNPFLGSRQRKLFELTDLTEHLTITTLKQPVPFDRYDSGEQVEATLYKLPENTTDEVLFNVYMGGDLPETLLQTHRDALPNLLVFGNSYSKPLEPLLYASFNEMRSLDLRHYDEMSLKDYILQYQPDVVLCVRDYTELLDTEGNGTFW